VIDDCWQVSRDSAGNIIPDPERFPSGMKALADYIHSKGLKFGIYSCAGSMTCQKRPGSRGYQFQDARQYAAWGVDYLKYDWCYNEGQNAKAAYQTMSDALKASGRPIVFSMCEWGSNKPWEWGKGIGNLWRTTGDIFDSFKGAINWGGKGVLDIIDLNADLWPYAGPGHWNDPDMLEVGNGGMTGTEYKTHFSMWCMMAAPLMAGNDLRTMDDETQKILTNEEVIQVDQDALGEQGFRFMDYGDQEIWVKFLENDELAVCFFNRADEPWKVNYDWGKMGISHQDHHVTFHNTKYDLRDLWQHKDIGNTGKNLTAGIPAHGVLMLRLTPEKK
jgi:alpha-galactosidase